MKFANEFLLKDILFIKELFWDSTVPGFNFRRSVHFSKRLMAPLEKTLKSLKSLEFRSIGIETIMKVVQRGYISAKSEEDVEIESTALLTTQI